MMLHQPQYHNMPTGIVIPTQYAVRRKQTLADGISCWYGNLILARGNQTLARYHHTNPIFFWQVVFHRMWKAIYGQ